MGACEFSTTVTGRAAVIALAGELDLGAVGGLELEIERVTSGSPPAAIVLDLRGLTFMDSSGLRMILRADERARGEGRRFALVPGPEAVQRVFEITRMRERLEFIEDPMEAAA